MNKLSTSRHFSTYLKKHNCSNAFIGLVSKSIIYNHSYYHLYYIYIYYMCWRNSDCYCSNNGNNNKIARVSYIGCEREYSPTRNRISNFSCVFAMLYGPTSFPSPMTYAHMYHWIFTDTKTVIIIPSSFFRRHLINCYTEPKTKSINKTGTYYYYHDFVL